MTLSSVAREKRKLLRSSSIWDGPRLGSVDVRCGGIRVVVEARILGYKDLREDLKKSLLSQMERFLGTISVTLMGLSPLRSEQMDSKLSVSIRPATLMIFSWQVPTLTLCHALIQKPSCRVLLASQNGTILLSSRIRKEQLRSFNTAQT